MAKNSVKDYSVTASENTDIAGIGITGASLVDNFDNGLRTLMAHMKNHYDVVSANSATVASAQTESFTVAPDYIRTAFFDANQVPGSGQVYQKKNAGAQMLVNPGFDADTDWTKGTGWTIAAGVATKAAGTASDLSQAQTLVAGQEYIISGTVSGWTAGTLTPKLIGGTAVTGTPISANGAFSQKLTAVSGNNAIAFSADAAAEGSIDNVTLQTSGQPTHANKFSILLADGVTRVWYEGAAEVVNPAMFGARYDNTTIDDTAFSNFIGYLNAKLPKSADLLSGTVRLTKQVSWPAGVDILGGNITLDFSTATYSASDFPQDSCFDCDGGALVALPAFSGTMSKGFTFLTFASAPALSPGDTFLIYNTTDSSSSGHRTYYRDGENCRVLSVSGNNVYLERALLSTYTAAQAANYRRPNKSLKIHANLTIKGIDGTTYGARFKLLDDANLGSLKATGSKAGAVGLVQCLRPVGHGMSAKQTFNAAGLAYGLALINTEGAKMHGRWHGRRHAVTQGGGDEAGAIPCRYNEVDGVYSNDPAANMFALDAHGNAFDYKYSGAVFGGLTYGGNRGDFTGLTIINTAGFACAWASELVGCDHNFEGATLITIGADPWVANTHGVFDIGGNGSGATANTTLGGTIRCAGMKIISSTTTRPIVVRNRGATQKISIDLSRVHLDVAVAGVILCDAPAGWVLEDLIVPDMIIPSNVTWSIGTTARVRGWKCSGKVNLVPSTSASVVTTAVTFPRAAPRVPAIVATKKGATTGGKRATAYYDSDTTSGVTIGIATDDAAVFTSTVASDVGWTATLDE